MSRVKAVFERFDSGVWGEDPYDDDSGTPVIRSNEIDEGGNWRVISPALRLLSPQEKERSQLRNGDLLIVKSSGSPLHIGKTAIVTKEIESLGSCFSNFTGRIRVAPCRAVSKFIWYFLNNSPGRDQLFYHGTTTTGLINLGATSIGAGALLLPPLAEQQAIADYLDASCEMIEASVAAKRRQLEVLDRLRRSVMYSALIEGIDGSKTLCDTGVSIAPKLPIGWNLVRLKNIADIRYGLGQPPQERDGGVPMIRATDIDAGRIIDGNMLCIDPNGLPAGRDPYLKEGEIIVVRSGAYTGDSAIVPTRHSGAVAGYDLIVTVTKAVPRFVAYCLLSGYVLEGQMLLLTLRAAQPHLNAQQLGGVLLAVPESRRVQEAICDYLDAKIGEVNQIAAGIVSQIATLTAYRRSLIHECVTGRRRITESDLTKMTAIA